MNIIVITGASSGIGMEFAMQMDSYFGNIDEFWLVARSYERLKEVAKALGHRTRLFPMDITCKERLDLLEDAVVKHNAAVRMLINCAGYGMMGDFCEQDTNLELGMIRCLDEIAEQVRRSLGLSMTAAQIESCLRGESGSTGEQVREIIHREAGAYVRRLLSAITESGLDAHAMPAVFLGGGAALLKRHVSATDGLFRPLILDDVCLNAKGYERLVGQLRRNSGN